MADNQLLIRYMQFTKSLNGKGLAISHYLLYYHEILDYFKSDSKYAQQYVGHFYESWYWMITIRTMEKTIKIQNWGLYLR